MNRRRFLALLGAGAALAVEPRRACSFIWAPPAPTIDVFTTEDVKRAVAHLDRFNAKPDGDGYYRLFWPDGVVPLPPRWLRAESEK